jgi:hypothetical protein
MFVSRRQPLARWATYVVVGLLLTVGAMLRTTKQVHAQIDSGEFLLYQSHQSAPVGRAWSNSDRTVEYWAYIVGEYKLADTSNYDWNHHWDLEAVRVSGASYSNYSAFKTAILALSEMAGKQVRFQNHGVTEETVQN